MKMEPLNENELEWLDDVLTKYNTDQAILDVAELDGLITAVLSSPRPIEPEQWLVAIWGGPAYVPHWTSRKRNDAIYGSGVPAHGGHSRPA